MRRTECAHSGQIHARGARDCNPALRPGEPSPLNAYQSAFTLVEVMVGVGVMGMMLVTLYAGIEFGLKEMRLARENIRATQVLEEKMEVVRLFNWDQVINLPGYIPTTFTAPFFANNPTNPPPGSFTYTGTVLVTAAPLTDFSHTSSSTHRAETAAKANVSPLIGPPPPPSGRTAPARTPW